jgi:hypothetical protein
MDSIESVEKSRISRGGWYKSKEGAGEGELSASG